MTQHKKINITLRGEYKCLYFCPSHVTINFQLFPLEMRNDAFIRIVAVYQVPEALLYTTKTRGEETFTSDKNLREH